MIKSSDKLFVISQKAQDNQFQIYKEKIALDTNLACLSILNSRKAVAPSCLQHVIVGQDRYATKLQEEDKQAELVSRLRHKGTWVTRKLREPSVEDRGCLSSAERGVLLAKACMNAAGNFMLPMFIFLRKRKNLLLLNDAPPASFTYYHESGWINAESFLYWFRCFIEYANPSPQKPVLLILDGHRFHSKSMALIDLALENNVTLLCFYPHTTHRLYPLDVSFMAPLSAYYEQEVRKWLVAHPGRAVTIYQIGKLFTPVFRRAALMQTAIAGFKKT
ncbi:hypothetical protein ILUMI_10350 [Ignelater luminosus]|uniref:DDE-1 domain-containing protein n=1 Tax=Ignelater luminosus TaxID=2038154 RepID=A0A8K0GF25_IGNLU|nr:hypothetical protein ILUMI_10350 [Ignelater luminosus]